MELATSMNVLYKPGSDKYVTKLVDLLADTGFQYLDLNFTDYFYKGGRMANTGFTGGQWESWIDSIGERAIQRNIKFNQSHGVLFNYFDDRIPGLQDFHMLAKRSILASAKLGIKWCVFHPETPPELAESRDVEECKRRNIEYLKPLIELAEKHKVGIALENMVSRKQNGSFLFWRYCATPEELIDLVDSFNSKYVGICLDIGHAHQTDVSPASFALQCGGDRLKALHVQDNDSRSDQHLLPFMGTVDWEQVIKALAAIDYEGEFTYEAHNSIRRLPEEVLLDMLKIYYKVGQNLCHQFDKEKNK